jgi:hypothetical protein
MAAEVPVGKRTPAIVGVTRPRLIVLVSLPMSSDAKIDSAAAIETPAFPIPNVFVFSNGQLSAPLTVTMLRSADSKSCEAHPT